MQLSQILIGCYNVQGFNRLVIGTSSRKRSTLSFGMVFVVYIMLFFICLCLLWVSQLLGCWLLVKYSPHWNYGFSDPASNVMEGIVDLHHDITLLVWIVVFVLILMVQATSSVMDKNVFVRQFFDINLENKKNCKHIVRGPSLPSDAQHDTVLEIIWTCLPCVVLFCIAVQSFALLYIIEDVPKEFELQLKVIGSQWYWTYETHNVFAYEELGSDIENLFIPQEDCAKKFISWKSRLKTSNLAGSLRLLSVDNILKLPIRRNIRILVTASDVLHSFCVPALGLKIDACPGRLNQVCVWITRPGVYYGQCSEICGVQHAFMPIVLDCQMLLT